MDMELHVQLAAGESPDVAKVVVTGPITLNNLFSLQSTLRAQSAPTLVIDLTGVPYMDSAGLGTIMNAHISAGRRGGKLILLGVCARVRTLFDVTKVTPILNISN